MELGTYYSTGKRISEEIINYHIGTSNKQLDNTMIHLKDIFLIVIIVSLSLL